MKLGIDTNTGGNVVIKIVPRHGPSKRANRTTCTEITALERINHPNIVTLLEAIDDQTFDKIYLVLEYMELGDIPWRRECCELQRLMTDLEDHMPQPPHMECSCGTASWFQSCASRPLEHENSAQRNMTNTNGWVAKHPPLTSISNATLWFDNVPQDPDELNKGKGGATQCPCSGNILCLPKFAGAMEERPIFVPCLTFDQIRDILRGTLHGLMYLHSNGIYHRDIKPANLLLSKEFHVKIADFDISYIHPDLDRLIDEEGHGPKRVEQINDDALLKTVGTPAFMAPELCYPVCDEPLPITAQIDVWSLGVTLYCFIFAKLPFVAENTFLLYRKIATEQIHLPRKRLKPVIQPERSKLSSACRCCNGNRGEYEDVDEQLIDLVNRMLTRDPRLRIRPEEILSHSWMLQGTLAPSVGSSEDGTGLVSTK